MKAKSIHGSSLPEIEAALQQCREDGFRPTVALVFLSIQQDRQAVCSLLRRERIDIFGATSCGEFTDNYHGEGSIVILLLDLSKEHYRILFERVDHRNILNAGKKLAQAAKNAFAHPSLILCTTTLDETGAFLDGEALVETLRNSLGSDHLFSGGMAGDDLKFTGSYVFTSEGETGCGAAALVFDARKVSLHGMAVTGWKPMGIARCVTESKCNLLYSIDHKPAVTMYLQYLGRERQTAEGSYSLISDLSMYYPFIVERPGGGTVLRSPLQIADDGKALQIDIDMPEGTKFWFTTPPDFDIVDEVVNEAAQVKGANEADALLIFSCAGRVNVLGPLAHSENEGLSRVWNAPMAGFFTYGEFGRDELGKQEFHSGACSWVALKERET